MNSIHDMLINRVSTTETAYAKINLALDVTGKLENGYHLVKMIMESISIKDELIFTCSKVPGIRMISNIDGLSNGPDNLIIKAANAILERAGLDKNSIGMDIELRKSIPMAAGMAGGSSDAAAVLRAMNRMFDFGFDDETLCEIGVKIGADVPYCILGGSYLAEGIGEVLTPLTAPPRDTYLGIIKPKIDVSTKFVYEHLDTEGVSVHPDVDGMILAIENQDVYGITSRLGNVLRDVTVVEYPIVAELENFLIDNGALGALMSGSGPTVFGIFDDKNKCEAAIGKAERNYPEMFSAVAEFV